MKRILLLTGVISLFIHFTSFSPVAGEDLVDEVLTNTNELRKTKGLPALILNEELNAIAAAHSADMAKGRVRFGHAGFNKRYNLAKQKVSHFSAFAENVLYGASSGREAVDMWKKSPHHRDNILGDYMYTGIGIATDKQGRIFYTQVFVR